MFWVVFLCPLLYEIKALRLRHRSDDFTLGCSLHVGKRRVWVGKEGEHWA